MLYGKNDDFNIYQMHYAFDNLSEFLLKTKEYSNFFVTFVDESYVDRLKVEGYELFGVFRDYFNNDISNCKIAGRIEYLSEEKYKEASELTFACKNQSRGFMGQTKEWIAEWMSPKNKDINNLGLTHNTIIIHTEEKRLAGLICVGIYGHESEKGAVLWVRELAVHPDFQRRGIAEKLIRQALGYGNINGAKRAFLLADEINYGAIRLYEKTGFIGNELECEIDMVKY